MVNEQLTSLSVPNESFMALGQGKIQFKRKFSILGGFKLVAC